MTLPFPRYAELKGLTWADCFAFTRADIMNRFAVKLATVPGDGQASTRRLANLLAVMMAQAADQSASTVIMKTWNLTKPGDAKFPKIDPLQAEVGSSLNIGRVHWSPSGAPTLHVYANTIFDLLGACMAEAAHLPSPSLVRAAGRTKKNYFTRLISLYSHWCFRLFPGGDQDRRPAKVGLACVDNIIVLGCCIPKIPGMTEANKTGKEAIRKSRFVDLKARGRQEGTKRQILDPTKVEWIAQDYGNCAETWTFALLCTLSEQALPGAFGIAVNMPQATVTVYNEAVERHISRYAPLCVNCEKLMKQIARWGAPGDKVVENFTAWKWTPYPNEV